MLPQYVKFYYGRLSPENKIIYQQIYDGMRQRLPRIEVRADISRISVDDVFEIYISVYNDTPSFYYIKPACNVVTKRSGYVLTPQYLYDAGQIRHFDEKLMGFIKWFEKTYIKPGMTEYEKEFLIHHYLVTTVQYDFDSLATEELQNQHPEIYNVLGAILRRKAVCWGIACAFKLLCDYFRIKCFVVAGRGTAEAGEDDHAWNIVKIRDENYHVDATWDIKTKGDISCICDYLNLSDSLIRMNHSWSKTVYPPCTSLMYNYFHKNKLYVRSPEQIPGFVLEQLAKGKTQLAFKYANPMPDNELIFGMIHLTLLQLPEKFAARIVICRDTHNCYVELESGDS